MKAFSCGSLDRSPALLEQISRGIERRSRCVDIETRLAFKKTIRQKVAYPNGTA